MSIELRDILLPKVIRRSVRIYPSQASFLRHLFKHVLAAPESSIWKRYLPVDEAHWTELFKKRRVRRGAEQFSWEDPVQAERARRAYADVANVITEGLQHADAKPAVVRFTEERRNPRTGQCQVSESIGALSVHGCVMLVRGRALRTAFFASSRTVAPYDVYWAGLHHLLALATRAQQCKPWYSEDDGVWRTGVSAELLNPDTLTNQENPWPRPKGAKGSATLREDDPEFEIFNAYIRR